MDIRTVMCVFGVERWDQDIKFAIDFCETQGAHLTALVTCLGGVPAIATYEAISTAWLDEQRAEIERLAEAAKQVQEILEKTIGERGELEVMSFSLPVKMLQVEGFKQKVVRFTTDIPHLTNWGQPLLLGAGSILVAHTKDEFVLKKDLEQAVGLYVNLVKKLLKEE